MVPSTPPKNVSLLQEYEYQSLIINFEIMGARNHQGGSTLDVPQVETPRWCRAPLPKNILSPQNQYLSEITASQSCMHVHRTDKVAPLCTHMQEIYK
jgi:hypothetical protein